jgi:hypothetical protein
MSLANQLVWAFAGSAGAVVLLALAVRRFWRRGKTLEEPLTRATASRRSSIAAGLSPCG